MPHQLPVVGLTGGIASGKSTVGAWFQAAGVPVIDADLLAREVVVPGEVALAEIKRTFGDDVLHPSGELDRAALGKRVFSNRSELERLNQIMHPAIKSRAECRVKDFAKAGASWVIYEAALILENQLSPELAALVVVLCEPELQLERLMARNGLTLADAKRRLASQTTNQVRRQAADYLLTNDSTLEELKQQVDRVVSILNARFAR